jgi:hypothetical protein
MTDLERQLVALRGVTEYPPTPDLAPRGRDGAARRCRGRSPRGSRWLPSLRRSSPRWV